MEGLHPRGAGIDVHGETLMACGLTPGAEGDPRKEARPSGSTTGGLGWLLSKSPSGEGRAGLCG